MGQKANTLAVIPARGGSKSVPRKNIRPLCGAPLLAWTVACARRARLVSHVCVTTDDEEIRKVGIEYGAEAPFLRPADLATDRALAVPTIQHAVGAMEACHDLRFDVVVMLQPTSPLKLADDIDTALERLLTTPGAHGVISVVPVDNWHPMKMKKFLNADMNGRMVDYEKPPKENCPRQELPPVYMVNGVLYATCRDVLMERGTFQGDYCLGYVMPAERSVNIDTEVDFLVAEYECQRQGRTPPRPVSQGDDRYR